MAKLTTYFPLLFWLFLPLLQLSLLRSLARSARRPQRGIRKAVRPPRPPNRVSSQDADFSSVRPSSRSHRRLHWRGNFFVPQASAMKFGMQAAREADRRYVSAFLSPSLRIYLSFYPFVPEIPDRLNHQVHFASEAVSLPRVDRGRKCGRGNRTEWRPSPFPNAMPRTFSSDGRSDCRTEIFGMPVELITIKNFKL